jgi:hypothetical protein
MAINRNVAIAVVVNNKTAREYRCPSNDSNASTHPDLSTVYIDGKHDADFRFNIKLEKSFQWRRADAVVVDAYLNGTSAGGVLLLKSDRRPDGTWRADLDGVYKIANDGEDCKHLRWTFEEVEIGKAFPALSGT